MGIAENKDRAARDRDEVRRNTPEYFRESIMTNAEPRD